MFKINVGYCTNSLKLDGIKHDLDIHRCNLRYIITNTLKRQTSTKHNTSKHVTQILENRWDSTNYNTDIATHYMYNTNTL